MAYSVTFRQIDKVLERYEFEVKRPARYLSLHR
jgi:ActR/RegA family two-component response regulator